MNNQLIIHFPGGAGGNWLSNLVYFLEKNIDQALISISNFKKTCIDPAKYYDNFDTVEWVAWCWGILQREFRMRPADNTSLSTAREQASGQREFFAEYTKNKTSLLL